MPVFIFSVLVSLYLYQYHYHIWSTENKTRNKKNKKKISKFGQNLDFRSPARADQFKFHEKPRSRPEKHSNTATHNMGNKGNSSDKIVPLIEAKIQLFYVGM